jgi:DNA-binding GntR family transcriptional regulator
MTTAKQFTTMPHKHQQHTDDAHLPLAVKVANTLRARILRGELAGGTRLVESTLSEELGVSRVPVREALRLLSVQGLVVIAPRRGATVSLMGETQIREMLEVRATLEALNAQLAAQRHDSEQLVMLRAILEEAAQLKQTNDIARYIAINARFHEVLDQLANNTVLQEMMRPLRARTAMLFAVKDDAHIIRSCEEHESILKAVVAGDKELAALLARRHVYHAAGHIGALLAKTDDNE